MPRQRSEEETPDVTVAPVDDYVTEIRELFPSGDLTTITRLANLYRLVDYHAAVLEEQPGNSYSTDMFIKLSTLAIRHEAILTGTKDLGEGRDTPEPVKPIRRGRATQ